MTTQQEEPEQESSPNDDFQGVLFSLLHMCRASSVSSSGSSPREPLDPAAPTYSRSHSMVSEDLSGVPPECPEWLHMVVARNRLASRGSRSRPGSRRNSAYATLTANGRPGGIAPSPLRHTVSVSDVDVQVSPSSSVQPAQQDAHYPDTCLLLDRLGSCEGLSAAVDIFYRRLCDDPRTSPAIKLVPQQSVRYTMMELMAMTLAEGFTPSAEDRTTWLKHCQSLLAEQQEHQSATAQGGEPAYVPDDAAYDLVLQHMSATLQELGLSIDF